MEQDSTAIVIGVILIVCLIALIAVRIAQFFSKFSREARYLISEMDRADDYDEYRYWRRELRCHYLCLIPFVTERNVRKIYRIFFHRAKHAEKRSDGIGHILAPSVIGILLCAVCLCGASWAWFTATTSAGTVKIQSATYTVSVTAKQSETDISTTAENGITTVTFPNVGIYTVTLTPTGTAKTGYCKITFDGTDYYTPQLISESFTLTVNAANTALTVTPQWGTYSGAVTIQSGDEITAAGYQQSSSQTPNNSVTTEPVAPATPSSTPSESETTDTAEPTPTSEPSTSDDTAASADSATQTIEAPETTE